MTTKESLGIFWQENNCFEEVSGMYFYGLWRNELPDKLELDEVQKIWVSGKIELNQTKFDGEDYLVYGLEIHIEEFPKMKFWLENIENILSWFHEKGSVVSWCGGEDCSPNPIIFNSKETSSGNVYASFAKEIGFLCNADLNQEIEYLNDEQLGKVNGLLKF